MYTSGAKIQSADAYLILLEVTSFFFIIFLYSTFLSSSRPSLVTTFEGCDHRISSFANKDSYGKPPLNDTHAQEQCIQNRCRCCRCWCSWRTNDTVSAWKQASNWQQYHTFSWPNKALRVYWWKFWCALSVGRCILSLRRDNPNVGLSLSIRDIRPIRIVPMLHPGFQVSDHWKWPMLQQTEM